MPKLGRRSEPQQLQYYYNNNINAPTSYAPFGTDHTPWIKSRIVGSRLVPVLERRANPQGGITPRSYYPHIVDPIAPKPNQVDPNILKEYTRKIQSVNQANYGIGGQMDTYRSQYNVGPSIEQEFSTLPKPTTYARYRPDSKDLGNRYVNLPPIDQNRSKMEKSTIFEPESWTRSYRERRERTPPPYDSGPTSGATNGYQSPVLFEPPEQRYDPPPPPPQQQREYPPDPPRRGAPSEDDQKYQLLKLLPSDTFLPEQPLSLSRDEEEFLLMLVRRELSNADSNRLKDVYLDITENYDRTLSGWCHYKNLFFSLSNAKFNLSSDLLRLIASMFVSPSKLQEVNYEKFLSFIGTSLTDNQGRGIDGPIYYQQEGWPLELYSPRSGNHGHENANQYYTKEPGRVWSPQPIRPATPPYDQDISKLMKLTEQQLHEADIDFESLVLHFQQYDREMRETLSADQIKGVLVRSGIALQDSLMNKILDKCGTHDGQYNWLKFVDFLEKTGQKAKTGLPIPRSKKPLEYAKQVPSPVPQWPHAASTEVMEPVTPLWKKDEYQDSPMSTRNPPGLDREQSELYENKKKIADMDRELRQLEVGYEDMKKKLHSPRSDSPWFKMFMEFANALYKQDSKNSGYLPPDEVLNWTRLYNSSYNLDIPEHIITSTLSETCTHNGRVNIHNYLTKLGSRNW